MTPAEALRKSQVILRSMEIEPGEVSTENFLAYAELCSDIVLNKWHRRRREECPWLKDWAATWRQMHDEFDVLVRRDPMILYTPKNKAAEEFHRSQAFIRFFRAGNRTSKTQSGYAEHYFLVTGQNPYRPTPAPPNTSFILAGLPFKDYAPKTFEKKMLTGEDYNPLSPMFPEDGKWFRHYDPRKHVLTIACQECAEAGKAQSCPGSHPRSQINLVSSEQGVSVLEAFAASFAHIDEHVPEDYYKAAKQRIASIPGSYLIVTATPLHGPDTWEERHLTDVANGPPEENRYDPEDAKSPPLVSVHQISQYEAGITPHHKIQAMMRDYDEFEIQARIYGKPMALAKRPVFDRKALAEQVLKTPTLGTLSFKWESDPDSKGSFTERVMESTSLDLAFNERVASNATFTGLRVWEKPEPGAEYLIGVDVAAGLQAPDLKGRVNDASCATVVQVVPDYNTMTFSLKVVAQFWGWVNPLDYALDVFKVGCWYNWALVAIELTGGHGRGTMLRLRELAYQNIFRDMSKPEIADIGQDARLGVETNQSTKPFMVSAMQALVKDRRITIPCSATINEMNAFEQETTGPGGVALMTPRYRGAGGHKDDRVMSLCIIAGVATQLAHGIYDFSDKDVRIMGKSEEAEPKASYVDQDRYESME